MGGIYAYYLGSRLLSSEEQNKTAEFLLSRPLSRGSILVTKLLVFLFSISSFILAVFLVGMISCGLASDWDFSIRSFSVLHLYGLVFCCFIGVVGIFVSVSMKKGRSSLMTGIGIVMGSYMFDMIIRITDKAQFLAYLSPFKYMDINATSPDYGLEGWRILVLLGASGLLISFSKLWYARKDILI
jgi:ABC-2 type transport system permease protein